MMTMTPSRSVNASIERQFINERMDVVNILTHIGLDKYIGKFMQEQIDILAFSLLDAGDLTEMNIPEDDQRIILDAIKLYDSLNNF